MNLVFSLLFVASAWSGTPSVRVEVPVEGQPVQVALSGLNADESYVVAAGVVGEGEGPCSPAWSLCSDVLAPELFGPAEWPTSGGVTWDLSVDLVGAASVSVQLLGRGSGASGVVTLPVLRAGGDADGDGLSDLDELAGPTDPLDADSDDDFLPDGAELALGTSPTDPDSDGDGLRDGLDPRPTLPGPAASVLTGAVFAMDPTVELVDPEFDPSGRIAWQTRAGEALWVASVDPLTGDIVPPDGRGTLVDTDLASIGYSLNGPEWFAGATGPSIAYVDRGPRGPQVAIAWPSPGGVAPWSTARLPGTEGGARPFGTGIPGDTRPILAYLQSTRGPTSVVFYDLRDRTTWTSPRPTLNVRFIPGTRTGVLSAFDADGIPQLEIWDATRGFRALSDSDVPLRQPGVVSLDERGGEWVMVTTRSIVGNQGNELAVLHDAGGPYLSELTVIRPPPGLPWVESPEVFTYDGRGYVLFAASSLPWRPENAWVSQVWLASLDPASPEVFRAVCDPEPQVYRDPEIYTGGARPWVFYSTSGPTGLQTVARCELGL